MSKERLQRVVYYRLYSYEKTFNSLYAIACNPKALQATSGSKSLAVVSSLELPLANTGLWWQRIH
jgi:hypothetical protein